MPVSTTDEARVTTKNLSALLLMKILQYPFLILFLLIVPRLMGPETYGEYALFISIVMIASSITDFGGASEIFSRFVPEFESHKKPEDSNRIFGNIIFLQNIISIVAGIVFFPVFFKIYGDQFPIFYFILIIGIFIIRNNYSIFYTFLFGLNDLAKANSVVPLRRVLSLVGILVLYHYFGFLGAIISTIVVDLCLSVPALYWTRNHFFLKYTKLDIKFLKPYLRYGVMFYLSAGLFTIWQKMGNVLIERMTHNAKQVAVFDIANQLFMLVVAFIIAISFAFAPIFTKFTLEDKEYKLTKWSSLAVKYLGVLCTIMFFGFAINGEQLISLALGSDYRGSYLNGVIQLIGIFPLIIAYQGVLFAMVYKQPQKYFISLVVSIVFFVIAASIFIPQYGAVGCAGAMSISCLVHAVFMYFCFRKYLSPCLPNFIKTIGFGIIFLSILWKAHGLAIGLTLFSTVTLIYIVLLFVSKVVTIEECSDIIRALRKKHVPLGSEIPL